MRNLKIAGQRVRLAGNHWAKLGTYFVVLLWGGIFEVNSLLKDVADFVEFDALRPVIKMTGDVNVLGGVLPVEHNALARAKKADRSTASRSHGELAGSTTMANI